MLATRAHALAGSAPKLQPAHGNENARRGTASARSRRAPAKIPRAASRKWSRLANPFAYVAMNTVGAVIPHLADRFQLTATQSGLFCSLWFYALRFVHRLVAMDRVALPVPLS